MSEEKVASNTQTMVQRLEDLRTEHMSLINSLDSPKTEKSDIILKNIKCIDVGLDEAQLMMEFTLHLQNVEIEKHQLNVQLKQLSEENRGLRNELKATQDKLKIFEKLMGNAGNEKSTDESILEIEFDDASIEPNALIQDCDYESDSTLTPREESQSGHTNCDESESLSRFLKLKKLAMQYAFEGNYEVALPLSQQAVDNLKKTTVGCFHPYITKMMSIVSLVYGIQKKYKDTTKLLHAAIREKTEALTLDSN
ncbi:kinesin light chain-like [Bradysia coprophila]|uniref:kinesin light chain-like n=1 Tax=Bradysia coprophila TaxID=38358 RepID=UPI00187DBE91|nr:kinesin light chain-like [Bradysia coprophila]